MPNPYRVRIVVCASGERLPLLLRSDGIPVFLPNVFAISAIRGRARAANTIERYLRALGMLLLFAERERIDLHARVHSGRFLSLPEVDALAAAARIPVSALARPRDAGEHPISRRPRVISLERHRASPPHNSSHPLVRGESAATRLRVISSYLKWLAARRATEIGTRGHLVARDRFRSAAAEFHSLLRARIPSSRHRPAVEREGLSDEELEALYAVAHPDSPTNPWRSRAARIRNWLLIMWALLLGPRRGELLSARIDDLDFRQNTLLIVRRPDSADDPRRRQPLVKTQGRQHAAHDTLLALTKEYILNVRRSIPGARRHGFLFVDVRRGAPLSHSAFTKVFSQLKNHPALTSCLTAHSLRHSWNDHFSALMDKHAVRDADEEKFRSYLQGWEEGSGTAATYTRRHVREKARKASLDLQSALLKAALPHTSRTDS